MLQTGLGLLLYTSVRGLGVQRWAALAAVAMAWLALTHYGMRPDAMALLLTGTSAWASAGRYGWRLAAGGFLGAAAVSTQPFALTLVVPLHSWLLWHFPNRLCRVLWTASGVTGALALFTLSINGEWREFADVFLRHSEMVTPGLANTLPYFWNRMTMGMEASRQALGIMLVVIVAIAFPYERHRLRAAWWSLLGLSILGLYFYSTFMVNYLVQGGLILAMVTLVLARRPVCGGVLVGFSLGWLHLGLWLQLLAPLPPSGPSAVSQRMQIDAAQPTLLLIDAVAMRRLYDFKPIHRVEDFVHYRPAGYAGKLRPADLKPGMLACATAHHYEKKAAGFGLLADRIAILGHSFGSLPAQPEPLIIRPD